MSAIRFTAVLKASAAPPASTTYYTGGNPFRSYLRGGLGWASILISLFFG